MSLAEAKKALKRTGPKSEWKTILEINIITKSCDKEQAIEQANTKLNECIINNNLTEEITIKKTIMSWELPI